MDSGPIRSHLLSTKIFFSDGPTDDKNLLCHVDRQVWDADIVRAAVLLNGEAVADKSVCKNRDERSALAVTTDSEDSRRGVAG